MTSKTKKLQWMILSCLLIILAASAEKEEGAYASCDVDSVPSSKSASSLDPNRFHKICPPSLPDSEPLGQPICGDGTAFSFLYTSPTQRSTKDEKILIEFTGGGACWDLNTCSQNEALTFPTQYSRFVGLSCGFAQTILQGNNINLLCSTKFGEVDMSEYHTIFIPYCSQDVHVGDSEMKYGSENEVVYHHGAHNTMSVLSWVYRHFPNPSQIALTGCSAGAGSLPIIYDLLNAHYNKVSRTSSINVIMDSPVYLTPEYFVKNEYSKWNPWTLLNRTQLKYNEWREDAEMGTKLIEEVLTRGSNRDQWGFVSHKQDEISLLYLEAMSGNIDVTLSDWYEKTMESINKTMKFDNFDTFLMDGEGHCTFGLSLALEKESFAVWAGGIFKDQKIKRVENIDAGMEVEQSSDEVKQSSDEVKQSSDEVKQSSAAVFLMNVFVGCALILICVYLY